MAVLPRLSVVGVIVIAAAMVDAVLKWADYDIFWHLANGRLMVESGLFPSPDRFSWSMAGHQYVDFSAQVDRLFYLLWRVDGAQALGLFSMLSFGLALLPFAFLIARLRARPIVECITLCLVITAMLPYVGARPQTLAWIIFGWLVYLIARPFGWRKALIAGVGLGVWANLHGSFEVGFGLVGVAAAAWLIQRDYGSASRAASALGLGFGLSLLSPYGLQLWLSPLGSAFHNPIAAFNQDWASLRPLSMPYLPVGVLLLAALGLGIWRITRPRAIAGTGLALATIQLARFTPFSAPLLGYVVLERLVERFPWARARSQTSNASTMRLHVVPWVLLLAAVPVIGMLAPSNIDDAAFYPLPVHAVDVLLTCGAPAPVWNDYNWGGYLLWRGGARYTVGIDGRAETLYSASVLDNYVHTILGQQGWQASVQQSPAQYALLPSAASSSGTGSEPPISIGQLPGWRQVYTDNVATLSIRDGAPWHCSQFP